jgi:chemotaxis protein CheX
MIAGGQELQLLTIQLSPMLDHYAAAPLATELRDSVGKDLALDGSQVQRLGAQCLQVLLSASRTWGLDGKRLLLTDCSHQFIEDARLLGVELAALETGNIQQ